MDEATLEYYEKNAAVIAPGYDAASAGVSALFPFVFKPGQRVLDIGAGSGRDMARLLSLGIDACTSVVQPRQVAPIAPREGRKRAADQDPVV